MQISDQENKTDNELSSPLSMERRPPYSSRRSERGFAPVLRNTRFLTLWGGQIFSQLADKFYIVLMVALLESHFRSPGQPVNSSWISAIWIANTIPAVLFGSIAGIYTDRWSKQIVLVISNLARGGFVLSLPLLLWLSQGHNFLFGLPLGFIFLLVITFLVSTFTQFFAPAEQAALSLIVKNRNLLAANSISTTTMMAVLIIGAALGERLFVFFDNFLQVSAETWDLGKVLVVGGAYVISGLVLIFLKTRERPETFSSQTPHVFEDILDGIRYLKVNHRVRNALIQIVILYSVLAALYVLTVIMAEGLGLQARQFGYLLAAAGIGLAINAAFITYFLGRRYSDTQLSLWGTLGMALSLIGVSFATNNLWMALGTICLLGFFAALVGVPMQTRLLAETPIEMRGKIFGLENNAVNIALTLPLALTGPAEQRFGLPAVLIVFAVLTAIGGILCWYVDRSESIKSAKVDK